MGLEAWLDDARRRLEIRDSLKGWSQTRSFKDYSLYYEIVTSVD